MKLCTRVWRPIKQIYLVRPEGASMHLQREQAGTFRQTEVVVGPGGLVKLCCVLGNSGVTIAGHILENFTNLHGVG